MGVALGLLCGVVVLEEEETRSRKEKKEAMFMRRVEGVEDESCTLCSTRGLLDCAEVRQGG